MNACVVDIMDLVRIGTNIKNTMIIMFIIFFKKRSSCFVDINIKEDIVYESIQIYIYILVNLNDVRYRSVHR